MVFIAASDTQLVIGFSGKLLVLTDSETPQSFLLPLPALEEVKEKKLEEKSRYREDNPICGGFSSCGRWFAVADVHKRLLIWNTGDPSSDKVWTLHREFLLEKRSVTVQFIPGQEAFLGKLNEFACLFDYNR